MVVKGTALPGERGTRDRAATMSRTPFDELVHRVNNLLGTIEVQAELARIDGTLPVHATALQQILDSARRTQDDVRRLRTATARDQASE